MQWLPPAPANAERNATDLPSLWKLRAPALTESCSRTSSEGAGAIACRYQEAFHEKQTEENKSLAFKNIINFPDSRLYRLYRLYALSASARFADQQLEPEKKHALQRRLNFAVREIWPSLAYVEMQWLPRRRQTPSHLAVGPGEASKALATAPFSFHSIKIEVRPMPKQPTSSRVYFSLGDMSKKQDPLPTQAM